MINNWKEWKRQLIDVRRIAARWRTNDVDVSTFVADHEIFSDNLADKTLTRSFVFTLVRSHTHSPSRCCDGIKIAQRERQKWNGMEWFAPRWCVVENAIFPIIATPNRIFFILVWCGDASAWTKCHGRIMHVVIVIMRRASIATPNSTCSVLMPFGRMWRHTHTNVPKHQSTNDKLETNRTSQTAINCRRIWNGGQWCVTSRWRTWTRDSVFGIIVADVQRTRKLRTKIINMVDTHKQIEPKINER